MIITHSNSLLTNWILLPRMLNSVCLAIPQPRDVLSCLAPGFGPTPLSPLWPPARFGPARFGPALFARIFGTAGMQASRSDPCPDGSAEPMLPVALSVVMRSLSARIEVLPAAFSLRVMKSRNSSHVKTFGSIGNSYIIIQKKKKKQKQKQKQKKKHKRRIKRRGK